MSQALAPRDPEIAPAVVTPMAMIDRARDEPARIEATAQSALGCIGDLVRKAAKRAGVAERFTFDLHDDGKLNCRPVETAEAA